MTEKLFYADVDTPFHVWVRERGAQGYRWVLRHASQVIGSAGHHAPPHPEKDSVAHELR
jgi:hypothetical protein